MPFDPTPEQRRVLGYRPGCHGRVLAGPGTGKSATVVKLIDDLMSLEAPPKVRLLTFTRAATAELAAKVSEHPAAATLRPSTIHSFALSVLMRNPDATDVIMPLRIADDWERERIIDRSLGRRIQVRTDRIDNLFRELAAKWERLDPRDSSRVRPEERARFLAGWQEHRRLFGYTMLAELPDALRRALTSHTDLEGTDFDLLVVDEYQDLNVCDLEVLRILATRGAWILGVGDDDQSIYSFRHAAPEGIRRFPEDYPGSEDFPLSVTHRCGSRIVEWALHVIEGDLTRSQGRTRLTPAPQSAPGEVALLHFPSAQAEARGIAGLVHRLVADEGIAPRDILILLRSDYRGAWSKPIKEELGSLGIETGDPNEVKEILARPRNRLSLALLKLLQKSDDALAWATVLELSAGIGETFQNHAYDQACARGVQFGTCLLQLCDEGCPEVSTALRQRVLARVGEVRQWLAEKQVPTEVPEEGWGAWIAESLMAAGTLFDPEESLRNLLVAVDGVAERQSLDRYVGQIEPLGTDLASARSTGVRIMSIAASKGLTAEAAIIPGLEEGVIPGPSRDMEEERRLLYVGMTRAKRFFFGTWATRRTGPTARSGTERVQQRRSYSRFLMGGPVETQDGVAYLR